MLTQLQIVNRILRRLREDVVTATTDNDYAELVSLLVADSYEEVIDAHDWETFKHRVLVDIAASTTLYDLTATVSNGGGVRNSTGRVCKIDSELQFMEGDIPQAWIFDSDSDDTVNGIKYLSPEAFRVMQTHDRDDTDADPCYFTIYPEYNTTSETTKLWLEVYPAPTQARVMEMIFSTRPDPLAIDGTTDASVLLVPERCVQALALMYAANERGEELGEPGNLLESRFVDALGAAIERDITVASRADRYDWRRD